MVELCPVFLCGNRVTRGTRRHDKWGARDCLLGAIRRNTLLFPLAPGARLSYQYPSVFQRSRPADTRLRASVYLASHDIVVGCCAYLPTQVNGLLYAGGRTCPIGAPETGVLECGSLCGNARGVTRSKEYSAMGDVGIMGLHVPGMSWREIRESAVLAEELGYSCLSMGESWG